MKKVILLCMGLALALPGLAEEIKIPVGQQGNGSSVQQPSRGSSQASVLAQFGEPQDKKAAVGQPPISSWRYADFTVYFEKDHVLHSVVNPPAQPATANP